MVSGGTRAGYVQLHTHYDAQVFWDPSLSPSCYHGVTTVFGGFCGFSIAPLSPAASEYLMPMLARVEGMPLESLQAGVPWDWTSFGSYLDRIDGTLALNAGFFAGHSALRRVVMGERAVGAQANEHELNAMLQLLDASLREGALGFSTTISATHNDAAGKPVPSRHAAREEMLALAGVCRAHEGTALEMVVGDFNDQAINLLTDLSLAAQRPINWNVLSINSTAEYEQQLVARQLAASDYARDKGARVVALTVPQTMTIRINLLSGFVFDAFPGWNKLFDLPLAERLIKLHEPAFRDYLQERATSKDAAGFAMLARWENMLIAQVFAEQNTPYEGKKIGAVAAQLGKTPLDTLLDIALADEVNGIEVIKRLWEGGLREKPRIIVITALGNKAFRGPRAGRPWVEQLNEHERTLVTAFFEKPYGWHAFLSAVAKAAGVDSPEKIKLIPDNE